MSDPDSPTAQQFAGQVIRMALRLADVFGKEHVEPDIALFAMYMLERGIEANFRENYLSLGKSPGQFHEAISMMRHIAEGLRTTKPTPEHEAVLKQMAEFLEFSDEDLRRAKKLVFSGVK